MIFLSKTTTSLVLIFCFAQCVFGAPAASSNTIHLKNSSGKPLKYRLIGSVNSNLETGDLPTSGTTLNIAKYVSETNNLRVIVSANDFAEIDLQIYSIAELSLMGGQFAQINLSNVNGYNAGMRVTPAGKWFPQADREWADWYKAISLPNDGSWDLEIKGMDVASKCPKYLRFPPNNPKPYGCINPAWVGNICQLGGSRAAPYSEMCKQMTAEEAKSLQCIQGSRTYRPSPTSFPKDPNNVCIPTNLLNYKVTDDKGASIQTSQDYWNEMYKTSPYSYYYADGDWGQPLAGYMAKHKDVTSIKEFLTKFPYMRVNLRAQTSSEWTIEITKA
eukprot:Nk52_evm81s2192 gene=Nk52_evmTU81s2192